jgi:hypothetical protein
MEEIRCGPRMPPFAFCEERGHVVIRAQEPLEVPTALQVLELSQRDHRRAESHLETVFRGKAEVGLLGMRDPEGGRASHGVQCPDESVEGIDNLDRQIPETIVAPDYSPGHERAAHPFRSVLLRA